MDVPAPKSVRRRFFVSIGHAIHITWPVLSIILAIQLALGLLIAFVEGWPVGEAIYFTFVTGLTIGYGDLVPRQALAQRPCNRDWCLWALPHWAHSGDCGLRYAHSAWRSRQQLTSQTCLHVFGRTILEATRICPCRRSCSRSPTR